jgi:Fic family protein
VPELTDDLMAFANAAPRFVDPIVAASVLSFGFVYIHPFMDGNGRLSRFLFHQALCQSGRLEKGLLLPVSVAMKRNEADYLAALQQFSRLARER